MAGIFWILEKGAKWKDLPREYGSKSTVHGWFRKWVQGGVFEAILRDADRGVEQRGDYRLYECFVDATFSRARGFGNGISCTKVGKDLKIMILIDARGLPVAVDTAAANRAECHLVQEIFDFMLPTQVPERIIGDKAYDSDPLDSDVAELGSEMIAPRRRNHLPENKTQGGRPLRRDKHCWKVERTIAWLQNFRRLCIRRERSAMPFQGFLNIGFTLPLV